MTLAYLKIKKAEIVNISTANVSQMMTNSVSDTSVIKH